VKTASLVLQLGEQHGIDLPVCWRSTGSSVARRRSTRPTGASRRRNTRRSRAERCLRRRTPPSGSRWWRPAGGSGGSRSHRAARPARRGGPTRSLTEPLFDPLRAEAVEYRPHGPVVVRTSAEKWVMPISRAATTSAPTRMLPMPMPWYSSATRPPSRPRSGPNAAARSAPSRRRTPQAPRTPPRRSDSRSRHRRADQELGRGLGRGMEALVARLLGVVAHCSAARWRSLRSNGRTETRLPSRSVTSTAQRPRRGGRRQPWRGARESASWPTSRSIARGHR